MHYVVERRECGELSWERIGEPKSTALQLYGFRNGVQYEIQTADHLLLRPIHEERGG